MIGTAFRTIRRLWAIGAFLLAVLALAAAGREVLPLATEAWTWHRAAEDPVALAGLELDGVLTPGRLAAEIDPAVAARDGDLARSFLALAASRSVPVDPARRAAVEALEAGQGWDRARDFVRGAFVGDAGGLSGVAGAFAADLVGIGDVRDLVREGWHAAQGEEVDEILVGLSAAGLAVTGATWLMAGTPAPVRAGLTLVKGARKAGRLSAPLGAAIGGMVRAAVDLPALRRALAATGKLDFAEARAAIVATVRSDRLAPLARLGDDTVGIYRAGGVGAVEQAFALARSGDEVTAFARLAGHFGDATRATVKLLGRSAIVLARSLSRLFGWLLAGAAWAFSVASTAAAFGRWLARVTPPHPRRRRAGRATGRPAPVPESNPV